MGLKRKPRNRRARISQLQPDREAEAAKGWPSRTTRAVGCQQKDQAGLETQTLRLSPEINPGGLPVKCKHGAARRRTWGKVQMAWVC